MKTGNVVQSMESLKIIVGAIVRTKNNLVFYHKEKRFIFNFFKDFGYTKTKPFNLSKWHHDLFLFTAKDENDNNVFIKLTSLERILKNENRAYKKLSKNHFLKNHVITHKQYIKKEDYKALILNRSDGVVLDENWVVDHVDKIKTLIKIIDEFTALSLIHRDIKLDNFIYEDGRIKIFDFSFMIDKTEKRRIKEINLTNHDNMVKLINLGIYYKPEPLKWDDYYSLYVIFKNVLENKDRSLSTERKEALTKYMEECKTKIGTNNYTILKKG